MNMNRNTVLSNGETVIWNGKPKKTAFVIRKSIAMMPVAIIWLVLDSGIIISSVQDREMLWFIIPFFTLHLMPVWIWLANVITAHRRWKHTNYYITNRRIIIQGGFFAVNETSLFFKDICNTQVHIGLIGKLFGTGYIRFDTSTRENGHAFEDLENPNEVYSRVQKIVLDIQTDMEYPNALRPEKNEGYNTEYRP